MNKLRGLIENLDESELRFAHKYIIKGEAIKLIEQKINERRHEEWQRICPVCNSLVSDESMTLIFGPADFRKKASFCASDCLEYFLQRIKCEDKIEEKETEGDA